MTRSFAILLSAVALGALAYLVWHVRGQDRQATAANTAPATVAATDADAVASTNGAGSMRAAPAPAAGPTMDSSTTESASGVSAAVGPSPAAATGPQPLTQRNEERLDAIARSLGVQDPAFKDLLDLIRSEPRDPGWSDDVERRLQQLIALHGARFTAIQTRPPRCTRTVCMLVARGGAGTDVVAADWQLLMGLVMSDPWFGHTFGDVRTSVKPDGQVVFYITFFVRKD